MIRDDNKEKGMVPLIHKEVFQMAIEPLSSAMTYQAQTVKQPQQTTKTEADYTDGKAQETTMLSDPSTAAVTKVEEKDGQDTGKQGEQQQANPDQIRKAVEQLNKKMNNSEALFGIHEGTNRVTIKIVDKSTKEVIKELPPEKTLDMIAKAWELAGLLVDEKR